MTDKNTNLGILTEDINIIKSTELPIMDEISTGSTLTKETIRYIFKNSEIETVSEEEIEIPKLIKEEPHEMTIDDFINDFKL